MTLEKRTIWNEETLSEHIHLIPAPTRGQGRRARRVASIVVLVAACALSGCSALGFAPAPPTLPRTPTTVSVLWDSAAPVAPGGKPGSDGFAGVVCRADGDCVAYGADAAAKDADVSRPVLVTRHNGVWTPTVLRLPAGARAEPGSAGGVEADSCAQTNCVAIGNYYDAHGAAHFFANTRSDATMELPLTGTARAASLKADFHEGDALISCGTDTDCLAVLSINHTADLGNGTHADEFQLMKYDGHSWRELAAPLPAAPAGRERDVDQLSCTSSGRCVLAGHDTDGKRFSGWLAVTSRTGWVTTTLAGGFINAGLSCADQTSCRAVGDDGHAMLVHVAASGTVTTQTARPGLRVHGLGCYDTTCALTRDFYDKGSSPGGSLGYWSGTKVTWTPAEPSNQALVLDHASCASTTSCIAVGGYQTPSADSRTAEPLVEVYSDHQWTASAPSRPAGFQSGYLNGVACVAASDCVVIGVDGDYLGGVGGLYGGGD